MSDLSRANGPARRILNRAITTLENFSSVVILIMMVLTFVDVVGRYILQKPVFGASEMISALLALAIFSGLGVTNARDEHIVVELFDHRVRRLISPLAFEIIVQAFSVAAMTLIAVVLFDSALESYHINSRTVVLEMPSYYITGSIAFLALVSVFSQVTGVILKIIDTRHHEGDRAL